VLQIEVHPLFFINPFRCNGKNHLKKSSEKALPIVFFIVILRPLWQKLATKTIGTIQHPLTTSMGICNRKPPTLSAWCWAH
jgi:hypothetical protein